MFFERLYAISLYHKKYSIKKNVFKIIILFSKFFCFNILNFLRNGNLHFNEPFPRKNWNRYNAAIDPTISIFARV